MSVDDSRDHWLRRIMYEQDLKAIANDLFIRVFSCSELVTTSTRANELDAVVSELPSVIKLRSQLKQLEEQACAEATNLGKVDALRNQTGELHDKLRTLVSTGEKLKMQRDELAAILECGDEKVS